MGKGRKGRRGGGGGGGKAGVREGEGAKWREGEKFGGREIGEKASHSDSIYMYMYMYMYMASLVPRILAGEKSSACSRMRKNLQKRVSKRIREPPISKFPEILGELSMCEQCVPGSTFLPHKSLGYYVAGCKYCFLGHPRPSLHYLIQHANQ